MDSDITGHDIVRLTHKQLQVMAKKYETDKICEAATNKIKPAERQRKVKPERSIYVPGQSRLATQQRASSLEPSDLPAESHQSAQTDGNQELVSSKVSVSSNPVEVRRHSLKGPAEKTHNALPSRRAVSKKNETLSSKSAILHSADVEQQMIGEQSEFEGSRNIREKSGSSERQDEAARSVSENLSGERRRDRKPDMRRYVPKHRQSQTPVETDKPKTHEKNSMESDVLDKCSEVEAPQEILKPDLLKSQSFDSPTVNKHNRVEQISYVSSKSNRSPSRSTKCPEDTKVEDQQRASINKEALDTKLTKPLNAKTASSPSVLDKHSTAERNFVQRQNDLPDLDCKGELMGCYEPQVVNWGDIPSPVSDDAWSDDEKDIISTTNVKPKRNKRSRKKRPRAKQAGLTGDTVRSLTCNEKCMDGSDIDDEQDAFQCASLATRFEGLIVTNKANRQQVSRVPLNKVPSSKENPNSAQEASTPGKVYSGKHNSKGSQQSDQRQRRLKDGRGNSRVNKRTGNVEDPVSHQVDKLEHIEDRHSSTWTATSVDSEESNDRHTGYESANAKVGGIIHLPVGTTMASVPEPGLSNGRLPSHGRRGQNQTRGRAQGSRGLWDPKHPDAGGPSSRGRHDSYHGGVAESGGGAMDNLAYQTTDHSAHPGHPVEYVPYILPQSQTGHFYYPEYPHGPPMHLDGYMYGYQKGSYDGYSDEPHGRGAYELEDGMSQMRANCRMKVEFLIQEAMAFDVQLCNLLSMHARSTDGQKHIMILRAEIQRRFQDALLLDVELANRKNVEQMLWRSVFYQVIEMFRHQASADNSDSHAKQQLISIIDDGVAFYQTLLHHLQSAHGFSVDLYVEQNGGLSESPLGRTTKVALISCQRILICLGDLARYREQANHTSNYGRARSWYTKAQKIAPKNGRPYNQLAILALYTSRKIDAVYYYMRSLAASNPFLTARESLMQLFEEAAKKVETLERNRRAESERRKRRNVEVAARRRRSSSTCGQRVEVWMAIDGSRSTEDKVEVNDEDEDSDDLSSLPMVEVNKSFILDFLRVHGKLFTKIGMERFPEACGRLLREFDTQLDHTPSPMSSARLVQLMAVNMFAIDNTEPKGSRMEENCRSVLQEHAVQLGLDMFALLARGCTKLLKCRQTCAADQCRIQEIDCTLREFMPSLKAWSDWMTCHMQHWNPPPLTLDPGLGPDVDVWQSLADLFNVLNEENFNEVELLAQPSSAESRPVILPEDAELAGFVPLLSLTYSPFYVSNQVDMEIARDYIRASKLRLFADYLCGVDPPLMAYNVESRRYVSTVTSLPNSGRDGKRQHSEQLESHEDADDDVIVEGVDENGSSYASAQEDDAELSITALKARKEELAKKLAEQARIRENIKAAVNMSQHEFRAIQLEICPSFLVPDTNCFIDYLSGVERLLATKKFTIIVPLVVINELDGLSKGCRDRHFEFSEHAVMVRSCAKTALSFLEREFETRSNHYLRALTSEGTVLDTIAFRSEQSKDVGKNDDVILSCCLHYCQDKARDYMPKSHDEPIRLQRNVVLLTNDRNLRLKAHVHNVPTKTVPAFLQWAKLR